MSHRVRMALLACAGVIVALGPMFVSESAIRWVALEHGRAQLQSMAATMAAHADSVLDNATDALTSLSRGGVSGCGAQDLALIDDAIFARLPLREIGVYDGTGTLQCTNFGSAGIAMDRAEAIAVKGGQLNLSVVETRLPGHKALWLRRDSEIAEGGLAAIIESSAVVMDLLYGELRASSHARLELANGTPVASVGKSRDAITTKGGAVEVRAASARYPVVAVVASPQSALLAPFNELMIDAKIGGGIVGVALLAIVGMSTRRRSTLESGIDDALAKNQFVPYYQPIVDSTDGRVAGCEMLLRWIKPNGEVVSPDAFIPYAEATGQIVAITRRVMAQVAIDMADICAECREFSVSINLVAEHLATSEIVDDVRHLFAKGPVGPRNLVFEVTERHPLKDLDRAKSVIGLLQALGCKVALDDAGTGHGGLAYIQTLGLDAIKIDQMFVAAIGHDAVRAPIVDVLIDLGRHLGMSVVAEGVETEEQFAFLRSRGARYFQGYLFARPMPAAAFSRFVEAFRPRQAGAAGVPVSLVGEEMLAPAAAAGR